MIYPQNFEQKIGFDQIRSLIKEKCLSSLGTDYTDRMQFSTDYDAIRKQLNCTWEFVHIIEQADDFPADFFFDVRASLKRVRIEGTFLEESELLKFLNELRETRPELTTDDINRFCTELAAIRREGVGFDCEEIFTGVRCVAAPIFDYTGNLVATIGCSVPTVRITEESSALLIREVIQTAAAISRVG